MFFLPIKADFTLPRFPVLTLIVCLICGAVFIKQISDWHDFNAAIDRYCQLDRSRLEQMVFTRIAEKEEYGHCAEMMYTIATSEDGTTMINEIVSRLRPLAGLKPPPGGGAN